MTHWGSTLCGCILSASLLIGGAGGAIAAADPGSSDPTAADSHATESSSQDVSSNTAPVASTAETSNSVSVKDSGEAESVGASSGPVTLGATTTSAEVTGGGAAADLGNKSVAGSDSAVSNADKSHKGVVVSHSKNGVPAPNVVPSGTQVIAPRPLPAAQVSQVIAPVTKAITNAAIAAGSVPAVLASLPTSDTPITDVITAVQAMLTSVGAVGASLAQVPSDLASLLGFPAMAPYATSTVGPRGAVDNLGSALASAATDATVLPYRAALSQQSMVTPGDRGTAPSGRVMKQSALGASSQSGTAPIMPKSGGDLPSSLKHIVGAVLVVASLTALAAAALPGLLGLLMTSAIGVKLGHRQAKAAAMLRPLGIARFARLGPLGVVRSGSLIALAPAASRAARRQPSPDASRLRPVA